MASFSCPKCSTAFSITHAQPIICPGCGSKFKSPKPSAPVESPPEFPPIQKFQVQLPEADSSPPTSVPVLDLHAPRTSKWRHSFEPRKYPAMSIIVTSLYVLAALCVVEFLLTSGVLIAASMSSTPPRSQEQTVTEFVQAKSLSAVAVAVIIAMSLVIHASTVLFLVASAESIRIWLDIQENTQEAAFHARLAQFAR